METPSLAHHCTGRYFRNKSDESGIEELEIVEKVLATRYLKTMYDKNVNELKAIYR